MTIKTKRFMSIIICGILLLSMVTGCDKGDESGQPVTEGENKVEDVTTDVVVVGGGGSGLTAAINVKYGNKDVILVEKMTHVRRQYNFTVQQVLNRLINSKIIAGTGHCCFRRGVF